MDSMEGFIKSLDRYRTGMCPISEISDAHLSRKDFKNFKKYLDDKDARAKDTNYSIIQEEALSKFVRFLKSKDYESAEGVSFNVPTSV